MSGKLRRSERLAALMKVLLDQPATVFPLSTFSEWLGAAKSTLSEDLTLLKECFESRGLGRVETLAGASGGVRYLPERTAAQREAWLGELARLLRQPDRVLVGGFLYMTDLIFSPVWALRVGEIFATLFAGRGVDQVVTVETKGIPLALMTARALGVNLVILRRDSRVTEGSAVSINYLSGSSQRIETMSVPRRALPQGSRVLLIDDFMKGGGTARGMQELMAEVGAEVVGTGVLVATAEPEVKRVQDYQALLLLEGVSEADREVRIRPVPESF